MTDTNAVYSGLVQRGLAPHIAEAFVLNGMDESGLNPAINEIAPLVKGSRGGFGVWQWTGPRRVALERFAASRGVPASDLNAQLDFLTYELQGPESAAWGKISNAKTTGEAAAAIVNSFLRPAEQHRARREAAYLGGASMPQNALAMGSQPAPAQPDNALAQTPRLGLVNKGQIDPSMFFAGGNALADFARV